MAILKPQFGTFPRKGTTRRKGLKLDLAMLRGGDLYDYSGNGNNGTNHGATWVAGEHGPVLSFNGTGERVEIPGNTGQETQAVTIIIKVKFKAGMANFDHIFGKAYDDSGGTSPMFSPIFSYTFDYRNLGVRWNTGHASPDSVEYIHDIVVGEWEVYSATYSPATGKKAYFNGSLDRENSQSGQIAYFGGDSIMIGARSGGVLSSLMEVEYAMCFNRALTAAEVKYLYDFPYAAYRRDDIALMVAAQGGGVTPTGQMVSIICT